MVGYESGPDTAHLVLKPRRIFRLLPLVRLLLGTTLVCASAPAFAERYHVPLFLAASHGTLQSFLRIVWPSCRNHPSFTIRALDDVGTEFGPIEIPWRPGPRGCGRIVAFNSNDLEQGNADKGLNEGIGSGNGNWQLFIDSSSPVHLMSYIRSADGLLAPMHDTVPFWEDRNAYFVGTLNPGRNTNQRSWLRIINPYPHELTVTISGKDDTLVGSSYGSHWIDLAPFEILTVSAQTLETKRNDWAHLHYEGQLGDGTQQGKWRLEIQAHQGDWAGGNYEWKNLVILNMMQTPTGHLLNLSPIPGLSSGGGPDPDFMPRAPSQWDDGQRVGDFNIEFVFDDNVPPAVRTAFENAAQRWTQIIVGDMPDIAETNFPTNSCQNRRPLRQRIDDLLVFVRLGALGGRSGPVGRANVCRTTPTGDFAERPIAGWVIVNEASTSNDWRTTSALADAIFTHELGHVLAFNGQVLEASGHLRRSPTLHFAGPEAQAAFRRQGATHYPGNAVPLAADGVHWHDDLSGELMASGVGTESPISQISVGVLADLGYDVDPEHAEDWYRNVFP